MLRTSPIYIAGLFLAFAGIKIAAVDSAQTPSPELLKGFAAIEPIDTHVHAYPSDPSFFAMLERLHLHVLDIVTPYRHDPEFADIRSKIAAERAFVRNSNGHAALCTTFDPFQFSNPKFAEEAIRQINQDFAHGAIAVKIWKNIGMELQNAHGQFVLPDDPRFEPIYQDVEAHGKTLIAHIADPDSCWQPPNPASPDYRYFQQHPEWYMYNKPDHPSKATIIRARDHMLEENPKLRVVGAHLGSLEANVDEVAKRLDRYPNFAVDLAARVVYLTMQPRDKVRRFLTRYQDRILYGTDLDFHKNSNPEETEKAFEKRYALDWEFFASTDNMNYRGHQIQGLGLPNEILRKIFHENAVKWIPGIISDAGAH